MSLHSKMRFESWKPALFDGLYDWDFLRPCFNGSKIMPMDLDAVTERNGHILIQETKMPGTPIEIGQRITLTTFWRKSQISVIHVEGKSPDTIEGHCAYWEWEKDKSENIGDRSTNKGNAFDLVFDIRRWFCFVNKNPIPTREEWDAWIEQENLDVPF